MSTEILPWELVSCEECGRKFVPAYSDIDTCPRCAKAQAQADQDHGDRHVESKS